MQDNNGKHVFTIINSTKCVKHDAEEGAPCWTVYVAFSRRWAPAVCGARIKRAGFTGVPSPASLSLRTPGGRNNGARRRA